MDEVRARQEAKDAVDYNLRNRKIITLRGPAGRELANYVSHFNYDIKDYGEIIVCFPKPKGSAIILPPGVEP